MKSTYLQMIKNLLQQTTGLQIKKIYEAHSRENEIIFDSDVGMVAVSINDCPADAHYHGLNWLVCRLQGL